jgi:putative membrane protein insertion efficiency factor
MTHSKTIGEFAVADGRRPGGHSNRPDGSWAAFLALVLVFLIQLYRWTLSPALTFLFGANSGCRFSPTCSQYAKEAIERHGPLAGGALTVKRLCRCHPLGGCGHDPVPEAREKYIFHG